MKVPDYAIQVDVNFMSADGELKTLKAGSFVKPIEACYLPAHIKNDKKAMYNFDPKTETFVYCRSGIVRVPKSALVIVE